MASIAARVFRLFKAMFCRHWCRLTHSLLPGGSDSPTLPSLVRTYEYLLEELDPEVVKHLHGLGLPIAALATNWICTAFSGHLAVEEVLLLWDRILGMDSLMPLPVLSAAIVCFRRAVLLKCQSSAEVLEVMGDVSMMQVVPLLQSLLF